MGVLSAILPQTGGVALDIAGILGSLIERRCQDEHDLRAPAHQVSADGVHRAVGPCGRRRAGEHRPRLGDRVNLAFIVLRCAERTPIVVVAAQVPLAVPGAVQHAGQPARFGRKACRPGGIPLFAEWYELPQDGMQEPAEPDALSLPAVAHPVHPVVPVTAAHQGKPVPARRESLVDGAQAVLEQRG